MTEYPRSWGYCPECGSYILVGALQENSGCCHACGEFLADTDLSRFDDQTVEWADTPWREEE